MSGEEHKKNLIYYLSLIGFFGIFSTTMAKNPVLPLFVSGMGGSPEILGIISAVSPFAGIVFSFPIGILSDRIGRRKLLIASGCVFLLAPPLYILISEPWFLVPVRFFHGIATAILGPVASAAIAASYSRTRGAKLGTYSSATLIGRTIAPVVGGAVLSFFLYEGGLFPYKAVYAAVFIVSIPAFLFCFLVSDENISRIDGAAPWKTFRESLNRFLQDRRLASTALADLATYFAFGAFETYLPIHLSSHGYSAGVIGFIFSIQILALALTKPLFGRLADRIDKRIQIGTGVFVIGTAMLGIPFYSGEIFVISLSLLFALGMSCSTVATSAYTGEIAERTRLGASMGALSSVMDIGHSFGPLVTGFVITLVSLEAGFMTSFGLCTVVALVFLKFTAGKRGQMGLEGRDA